MSLLDALVRAKTEEDVKDAYIQALGLKSYFKGLVDIQTEEVWFEAKAVSTPPIVMFAQLFFYVREARKRGEPIPAFLAVIDREKAAIMPTGRALALLDDKSIVWPKSGSGAGKELAAQVAPYVQAHIVEYEIANDEGAFIKAVKDAIRERRIIRTPITPDNLRQVFDRWVDMIGTELGVTDPVNYAVLFFADIMHDGTNEYMSNLPARMLMTAAGPTFLLNGKTYELASKRGYQNFWAIYHRPPEAKHRHYLLERRDSLLPIDEQKFKGAYYTPLHIVDKAYDELKATLGANWQDRYIVWDMCAGVGNLEAKHSNLRNVFMSTLDQADVTIMKSNPAFAGAEIFQYDYLNDDITDFGEIDYDLSNKLPPALRQAMTDAKAGKKGAKPILVLRHFRDDLDGWARFVERLPRRVIARLKSDWWWQAHGGQKAPAGDWTVWLLMAGRGFGKTRAGAEWVSQRARENGNARIALVGGSRDEVAKVMIEGPSGLIRVARTGESVEWKRSLGTVRFDSGAMAFVYSAEAAEGLRGPEHDFAWADELAKWPAGQADSAWDNLMMGLRLGPRPRVVVTTTPRPVPLLKRVRALDGTKATHGRTGENAHLPDAFLGWMRETYGGTRLGRQELDGELIEEVEGALFTRAVLEGARTGPHPNPLPQAGEEAYARVVVGVDPPASAAGTCGIVVCAQGADSRLYVLADASVSGGSPERWASAVAAAAQGWAADRVIAEKNQGGDMVASVLRTVDSRLPVTLVSASRGKSARAEPVAVLFEAGRAKLAGRFAELEDELAGLLIGGGYAGPGRSPDRADACVWAMTALMRPKAEPRVRGL